MGTQIRNRTCTCMTCDPKPRVNPYPCETLSNASMNPVPAILSLSLFGGFNCNLLVLLSVEPTSSSSPSVQGAMPVECLSPVCCFLWKLGVCVLLPCHPPALYISTLLEALVGDNVCWGTWGQKWQLHPPTCIMGMGI